MIQQSFTTPRALEELGISRPAIQGQPFAQRRRACREASGLLAPHVRKRYQLPLRPELDPDDIDVSGLTGGATVTWAKVAAAQRIQDVGIKFNAGGVIGVAGITYSINPYFGAAGSSYGPTGPLPLSGQITNDGHVFTFTGTVATNDVFSYSTLADSGAYGAAALLAAWILLHNRGVDPKTEADLQRCFDCAMAWSQSLGTGEGELEQSGDATPGKPELGPRGHGQKTPWDWLAPRNG